MSDGTCPYCEKECPACGRDLRAPSANAVGHAKLLERAAEYVYAHAMNTPKVAQSKDAQDLAAQLREWATKLKGMK